MWRGATVRGYGVANLSGRVQYVHRVLYESFIGPIEADLQLDHLCRVPLCVNPWHMESVTGDENNRRSNSATAQNARKTECLRGHPLTGENLRVYTSKDGHVQRICLNCANIRSKRWHARQAKP